MSFTSIASQAHSSLSDAKSKMEQLNTSMESHWEGPAFKKFKTKQKEAKVPLDKGISQAGGFVAIGPSVERLKEVKKQIAALRTQLASITGDSDEAVAARAAIMAKIIKLEQEKIKLIAGIKSGLEGIISQGSYFSDFGNRSVLNDFNIGDKSAASDGDKSSNSDGEKKASSDGDEKKNSVKGNVEQEKEFVNYYQTDYQNPYGYWDEAATTPTTIARSGCGPTAAAMVLNYLSEEEVDPVEIAEYCMENGYRQNGRGTSGFCEPLAEEYGLQCENVIATSENIRNALEEGKPIVYNVGPGDFTSSGHYIVLKGLDSDGNVIIADPNSRSKSEKTWGVDRLANQCQSHGTMWIFSK